MEGANPTSLNAVSITLVDSASEGFAGSLSYVAALTVLVYDILLTLDEERVCIWKWRQWSPTKCIFLLVRYFTFALLIVQTLANFANVSNSDSTCEAIKWLEAVGGICLEAAAEMYLVYRVYAFCGGNKYLLVGLVALYIGVQTTSFSLVGILAPDYIEIVSPVAQLRPLLGDCIPLLYPFKITSVWIIFLGFQSVLFACLVFQVVYRCYGAWAQGLHLPPLYLLFIRDGIWAYFLIVVSLVLCVVSAFKAQHFGGSFITWLFTTTSVCCCRLILNLRFAAYYKSISTELRQVDVSLTWNAVNPFIDEQTESGTTATATTSIV